MNHQDEAKNLMALVQNMTVEWKPLGGENGIAIIKTGQAVSKQKISDNVGSYPVINSGREPLGYIDEWNTENDPIGITTRGAGVGSITWQEGKYFRGNLNYAVTIKNKSELDVRFLYHILLEFEQEIHALCTFTGIPALNASSLKKLPIPIPPLEIQQKIAKILDKFTELEATLEATLEAELALRKRQYQYYRDFLFDFDNQIGGGIADGYEGRLKDVVWKTLGEVTLPTENIKWKYTDKIYQYIDLTSVSRENKTITDTIAISANNAPSRAQKIVKEHDVIFATTRPTLQRFTIISKKFSGEIASTGYCVLRANCKEVLPKWIYYQISTERFNQYVEVNQSGSAYPAISDAKVKEFKIPIPPIPEQEKIVAILDKFDTLTNSISEGLPHEIALRRKQYEHYREQLLAFPKAA